MPQDMGIDIDFDNDEISVDRELAMVQLESARQADEAENPGGDSKVVAGEVVDDGKTVEFMGRKFRVAEKIGVMPLLKFSMYSDMSTADPKAMSAMYAMLRDCIHPGNPACGKCEACKADREELCKDFDPGDWEAFERHAIDQRADAEEVFSVIEKVMEIISGRPTGPRSPSSGGRRAISGGSTGRSSGRRARGSRR